MVHRVTLRGSSCHPPWFIVSPSVVHRVNLRGSSCHPPWFTMYFGWVYIIIMY
ncbi:hypothetical protein HMPREF0663_11945 [Hoylesella oralis ATCC 33269]|uniref:Uncharacterized protein n=1 Tax=Hoylesella oralis ATCC 33269 TaxID=873533 RepID=E7RT72_9BACT|nr:hypothetical protein HMPREF0663_11945 [Hoylesella oralis ATCC 33269]